MATSAINDASLWPRRMGHLNAQTIQMLNNTANNGLEYSGMFSSCDICSAQKRKQVNHPKKANHDVDAPLALIFTDFIGPVSSPTIGGHRYVSKFADVFAKWKKVYLTTSISKAVETLRPVSYTHLTLPTILLV